MERLNPYRQKLLARAKNKEVSSFIQAEAVRRCLSLSYEEEQEAKASGRILGCRWVLTWKTTPPEDLEEVAKEAIEKSEATVLTSDGKRKAKARIVLSGYQRPDIPEPPVQCAVIRHLAFQLTLFFRQESQEPSLVDDWCQRTA